MSSSILPEGGLVPERSSAASRDSPRKGRAKSGCVRSFAATSAAMESEAAVVRSRAAISGRSMTLRCLPRDESIAALISCKIREEVGALHCSLGSSPLIGLAVTGGTAGLVMAATTAEVARKAKMEAAWAWRAGGRPVTRGPTEVRGLAAAESVWKRCTTADLTVGRTGSGCGSDIPADTHGTLLIIFQDCIWFSQPESMMEWESKPLVQFEP